MLLSRQSARDVYDASTITFLPILMNLDSHKPLVLQGNNIFVHTICIGP